MRMTLDVRRIHQSCPNRLVRISERQHTRSRLSSDTAKLTNKGRVLSLDTVTPIPAPYTVNGAFLLQPVLSRTDACTPLMRS